MANTSAVESFKAEYTTWTWAENKKFEIGLVDFPDGTPDRWGKIAASLGNKSAAEVKHHYALLLEDISSIEAGLVELAPYPEKNSIGEGNSNPKLVGEGNSDPRLADN
ncbi:hypothetical protein ACS0TY_032949 [Phlomoides rotata]